MADLSIHPVPPQATAAEAVRPAMPRARKSADAPVPQPQPQGSPDAATLDAARHMILDWKKVYVTLFGHAPE